MLQKANELHQETELRKHQLERKELDYDRQRQDFHSEMSSLAKENQTLRTTIEKRSSREKELMDTISTLEQEKSSILEKSQSLLYHNKKNLPNSGQHLDQSNQKSRDS